MPRREKIFWLAVGLIFVVGFIAIIPAHGEICKESQKTGEEACTSYRLVPFLVIEIGKILDALGVAITALATIAIAWFTLSLRRSTDRLWDAGERQRLLSERMAQQQLRAYVDIVQAEITNFGIGILEIRTIIKNSGQTPAYRVVTIFSVGADDYPRLTPFEHPKKAVILSANTLAPGGFQTSFNQYGPISQTQIDKIVAGKAAIWNWGQISYDDAFGNHHTSKFRLIYRGKVETDPPGGMSVDEEGNETT